MPLVGAMVEKEAEDWGAIGVVKEEQGCGCEGLLGTDNCWESDGGDGRGRLCPRLERRGFSCG